MKSKLTASALAALFLFQLFTIPDTAEAAIPISAPSAILIDSATSRILYAKTPHVRRPPASTTKLLTAIVAIDHARLDDIVIIPAYVEKIEPSKIYLKRGERFRVRDLVVAILVNSANDAAEALAYHVGGSRAGFAKLMNARARSLGCRNSNFVNPHGLPDTRQYATAYDLALIMQAANRYAFVDQAMRIRTGAIRSQGGRRILLRNHNKMLWRDSREILGKTGWTRAARHCFVGAMSAGNRTVVVAMLGSLHMWGDLKTLADFQLGSIRSPYRRQKLVATKETKLIQQALKKAGYDPGPADGVMGKKTVSAIKRFQKAQRLRIDGVPGSRTLSKLKRYF